MSASAFPLTPGPDPLHAAFLVLLPRVETHARIYFRGIACKDKRADRVAETVGLAWRWYVRLQERGKDPQEFPQAFACLVARAVKCGRRVAGTEKATDVMNERCQQQYGFKVESLAASTRAPFDRLYSEPHGQEMQDPVEERLQYNLVSPIPTQVQFKIDFAAWLKTLTPRERRIIQAMARNERTLDLSKTFKVSPGRMSQLRREFCLGWKRFCGDHEVDAERHAGEVA
jgi:hypothetical protein